MEQFDHLEVAQEAATILKAGDTNKAAAFLRKVAADFGAQAFAADLREEKEFYAEQLTLAVADIEWMACTLEGNTPEKPSTEFLCTELNDLIEGVLEVAKFAAESRERYAFTKEWTEVNGGSCMTTRVPTALLARIRDLADGLKQLPITAYRGAMRMTEQLQKDIRQDGINEGKDGYPKTLNPHKPGTHAHDIWLDGWLEGNRQA